MEKTIKDLFINNDIEDKEIINLLQVLNLTNKSIIDFVYNFNLLLDTTVTVGDEKEVANKISEFIKNPKNDEILRRFGLRNKKEKNYFNYYNGFDFEEESISDDYDSFIDKENDKKFRI